MSWINECTRVGSRTFSRAASRSAFASGVTEDSLRSDILLGRSSGKIERFVASAAATGGLRERDRRKMVVNYVWWD